VVSVLGGKITGYRAIAEDVTDAVCRQVGLTRQCTTADAPLPGARPDPAITGADGMVGGDPPSFLRSLYGSRAKQIMALAQTSTDLARTLSDRYPDIGAQVPFSVRSEHCTRVSDFIRRRTMLGASADQGWDAAPRVAQLMTAELGWSAEHATAELEAFRRDIAVTRAFKEER
jgi:glycerol-3-phosphate dehydrogenase